MSHRNYDLFEQKVAAGLKREPSGSDSGYAADYPVILDWFGCQKNWSARSVRQGCLMVYGWMPTIFRSARTDNFEHIASQLNAGTIDESMHRFANNSFVGTSKFLHFWRPGEYAIWDRRICATLEWGVIASSKSKFDDYQAFCRKYAKKNPGVSMRQLEQALFVQSSD